MDAMNLSSTLRTETAPAVRAHYDGRTDSGRAARHESGVFRLRNFNNFVKAYLLKTFSGDNPRVLDLACGKGGDLFKFAAQHATKWVAVDIAGNSVADARKRFEKAAGRPGMDEMKAFFVCTDIFSIRLSYLSAIRACAPFDVVNCQFAAHYAFETEQRARRFLQNAGEMLRPGGRLIMTIPDANRIVIQTRKAWKRRLVHQKVGITSKEPLSFGNSVFRISWEGNDHPVYSRFGSRYLFTLQSAVENVPEFLVHFPTLEKLAEESGFETEYNETFHDLWERASADRQNVLDCYRMRGIDEVEGTLPADEWEALGVYRAIVLRKTSDSSVGLPDISACPYSTEERDGVLFVKDKTAQ